jgi:hypothetical protein
MNRTRPLPRPEPTVPAFSYDPKTKQIHIVLDVGDYVPAQLADFFQVATDVMRLVRHRQECCERQVRIDAQIDALRRRRCSSIQPSPTSTRRRRTSPPGSKTSR